VARRAEFDHPDVMVSSTYIDLAEHRNAAIDALLRLSFFPRAMEFNSSQPGNDVIAASMAMVKKARAYIGIVSHRYGGVPKDTVRNPNSLSITELEYRAALDRGIPVLMFLMSRDHKITIDGAESNAEYQRKLTSLREDARSRAICAEFSSVEMLKALVLQSMVELREQNKIKLRPKPRKRSAAGSEDTRLPAPPAFVAIPDFTSGHEFVGRQTELAWLDNWASSDQPMTIRRSFARAPVRNAAS